MPDRKVYIDVKVRLIVQVDEGIEVSEVMDNMDYDFIPRPDAGATVVDMEIEDYEITDSK